MRAANATFDKEYTVADTLVRTKTVLTLRRGRLDRRRRRREQQLLIERLDARAQRAAHPYSSYKQKP